IITKKLIVLH
ncbi:TonB-dependent heme receptor A precursor, partial [Haemophilus influenzae]